MKVRILVASTLDCDLHAKLGQLYALEAFSEVWSLLLRTHTLGATVERTGALPDWEHTTRRERV